MQPAAYAPLHCGPLLDASWLLRAGTQHLGTMMSWKAEQLGRVWGLGWVLVHPACLRHVPAGYLSLCTLPFLCHPPVLIAPCPGKAYAIFALVLGLSSCTLPGFFSSFPAGRRGTAPTPGLDVTCSPNDGPTHWLGFSSHSEVATAVGEFDALLLCCLPACFRAHWQQSASNGFVAHQWQGFQQFALQALAWRLAMFSASRVH